MHRVLYFSGMYLGELTRYILCDLTQKGLLFQGSAEALTILSRESVFQTAHISTIESDTEGDRLGQAWAVIQELGLTGVASRLDAGLVRYVSQCVAIRASVLAAAGVSALLNKMSRRSVTVGMDGSLYKFHPHFQVLQIFNSLSEILYSPGKDDVQNSGSC